MKPASHAIWSAADAAQATQGKISGPNDWYATDIAIDSRTIVAGDLFVALVGPNNNAHDYVRQAFDNGAVAAIVSEGQWDDLPVIHVADTQTALEDLARHARERTSAKIAAVTGSAGKTSTKEMLATALAANGQMHVSKSSYNNHWGVPLSVASMHAGCDYAAFEIGMNHAGEIAALVPFVKPDVAIITCIAEAHLEYFGAMDKIADAKAEIFEGVKEGGHVVLPADDGQFARLAAKAKARNLNIVSFGEDNIIELVEASNGSRARVSILEEEYDLKLQIVGKHHVMNALAVLMSVKLLGGDVRKAARALEKQQPAHRRGTQEKIDIGDPQNPVTLIDESYNANPASMKAAFRVLALVDPGRGGRRLAFLGDMLEMGKDSAQHHADLAMPLKTSNIDLVYTCGQMMKNLHEALPANQRGTHKDSSRELAEIVPDVLAPGDVVMVKGSLGSKMDLIVEAMREMPRLTVHNRKVE